MKARACDTIRMTQYCLGLPAGDILMVEKVIDGVLHFTDGRILQQEATDCYEVITSLPMSPLPPLSESLAKINEWPAPYPTVLTPKAINTDYTEFKGSKSLPIDLDWEDYDLP